MTSKRVAMAMALVFCSLGARAQHEHHAMHTAANAILGVATDTETHRVTVKLGPLNLPAHSDHMAVAQPAPQVFEVQFDGWITAYHPSLVDPADQPLPGRMLHHVAFWNTQRRDFLCPEKDEHIFGAGGEMTDWPALPGFGYRVHKGDRIRVTAMFHNPTAQSYPRVWLLVRMEYAPESAALKSVYPAWFDVKKCGDSSFPLAAGGTSLQAEIPLNYSGRLLGVGGHLHDYGEQLSISDVTQQQSIATLKTVLDEQGHILSLPVAVFTDRGGFPLHKGDEVRVQARYGPPRVDNADGMAIAVGYFLPDNDGEMQELKK